MSDLHHQWVGNSATGESAAERSARSAGNPGMDCDPVRLTPIQVPGRISEHRHHHRDILGAAIVHNTSPEKITLEPSTRRCRLRRPPSKFPARSEDKADCVCKID